MDACSADECRKVVATCSKDLSERGVRELSKDRLLKSVEGIWQSGRACLVVIAAHAWALVLLIMVTSIGTAAVEVALLLLSGLLLSWLLLSWLLLS